MAALTAEPVAWECGENIILFNPDTVEAYAKRAEISPKPLYAVPPVPDECPAELLAFCELMIDSRITANAKADELWNACRSAMLNGGKS
ncbi:hypothetical protein LAP71_004095 [Salmonella enterica]|nr:hypothetical protein [Salmonella enterica]EJN9086320.1 hypothetical protein [Salmonella enterica]